MSVHLGFLGLGEHSIIALCHFHPEAEKYKTINVECKLMNTCTKKIPVYILIFFHFLFIVSPLGHLSMCRYLN